MASGNARAVEGVDEAFAREAAIPGPPAGAFQMIRGERKPDRPGLRGDGRADGTEAAGRASSPATRKALSHAACGSRRETLVSDFFMRPPWLAGWSATFPQGGCRVCLYGPIRPRRSQDHSGWLTEGPCGKARAMRTSPTFRTIPRGILEAASRGEDDGSRPSGMASLVYAKRQYATRLAWKMAPIPVAQRKMGRSRDGGEVSRRGRPGAKAKAVTA